MKLDLENPLLKYLLLNPEKKFYFNELCKLLKRNQKLLSSDIKNLYNFGIIEKKKEGNNSKIFLKNTNFIKLLKQFWLIYVLRTNIQKIDKNIMKIVVYGSFAKGNYISTSDLDILLLTEDKSKKIDLSEFSKLENYFGKEIGLTIYDEREYYDKLKKKNKFALEIDKFGIIIYDNYKNSNELLI